jgi:acyl-CoA synthetase (AMP-forming)/AMP-acid ligase II
MDRVVPRGVTGHIVTRTLAMGLGYNNDPESTAMTFKKCGDDPEGLNWIFTGDLGTMDQSGRVTIVDRLKDIIISGGENVPSVEVETVIMSHPAVRECAVVGIPDDQWGELVSAVIVKGEDNLQDHDLASELLELCRAHLSGYKIPKRFCFVEALPRSSFGKVLKRDLRAMEFARAVVTKEIKDEPRRRANQ